MNSLRTVFIIVFSALVTLLVVFFLISNWSLLREDFTLSLWDYGFSFSVISALVAGMLIASAVPCLYFSFHYFKVKGQLRKSVKQERNTQIGGHSWKQVAGLLANGAVEKAAAKMKKLDTGSHPHHKFIQAEVYMEQGKYEEVIQLLEPGFAKEPMPEEGFLIAEAYEQTGNSERAKYTLETLVLRHPDSAIHALLMLVEDAVEAEEWAEALKWAESCKKNQSQPNVDLDEVIIGAQYELLKAEEKDQSNFKKYLSKVSRFIKNNPSFTPAYVLQCDTMAEYGQHSKALNRLEKAYDATLHPVFLRKTVNLCLEKEQPDEAIRLMKQFSMKKNDLLAEFELGKLYFKLSMFDDARSVLSPLTDKFTNPHLVYYYLALAEKKCQHDAQAFEYMKSAFIGDGSERIQTGAYFCAYCAHILNTWHDRCSECGSWGTIQLNLQLIEQNETQNPPLSHS
ncbi:MAG: hypothetical protein CSA81_12090 [Acidobacteria bacterium]|nr:MAG: hypothetical protein CSA81_12090 [Acidobacteriota bacterium]